MYKTQRFELMKSKTNGLASQTDDDLSVKDQFLGVPNSNEFEKTEGTRPYTITSRSNLTSFRRSTKTVIYTL